MLHGQVTSLTIPDYLRQLAKVRRPQSCDDIPSSCSREPVLRPTTHVVTFGDIGETFVAFGVEHGVQPSEGGLTASEAVVVQEGDDGGECLREIVS